ncbi:hypothetical protein DPMN_128099 [Dreissena polymorpha]|uniref:Uncharacterized protein n=1 Tax=Dreissena polymorpha TaxID=45954 RepID=A0A9D4JZU0_DREPO|nr:hypothetical protein DPMN_128099 [Dreissena polymorpha]
MTMTQDLQKLLSIRIGSRAIIAHELEELQTATDENDRDSIEMILNNISEVFDSLKAIDEKILSQTEVERIPEEMTETATYTNQLKRKLQKLKKELISSRTIKPLTSQVCRRLQSPLMRARL